MTKMADTNVSLKGNS